MRLGWERRKSPLTESYLPPWQTTVQYVFSQAATLIASQRMFLALYKMIQTKEEIRNYQGEVQQSGSL